MRFTLIPFKNSQEIHLPKTLLAHCRFGKIVEVEPTNNHLIYQQVS